MHSHGWESATGAVLDGDGSNWGATQEDSGFRMKCYRRKPDQEGGKKGILGGSFRLEAYRVNLAIVCVLFGLQKVYVNKEILWLITITSLTCNILPSSFIDLCVLSGLEKQLSF